MKSKRHILCICTLCTIASSVFAQEADTLNSHILRDVHVKGRRTRSYMKSVPGVSVIDMQMLDLMPRIMGNADPMHYTQLLPGVQTNSEYDAGLHIQGCDNAHNQVSISGIPLYNVAHMLGFFSVFNATHFSQMKLAKSPVSASSANRLGGTVDMLQSDSVIKRIGGDISIGPLSSQGTLRLPISKKSSLTISAREAYINLLYSHWLKSENEDIRYTFGDYNLSWLYQPNERNTIRVEAYAGHDNIKLGNDRYIYNTRMTWGNQMASLHWTHLFGRGKITQKLYYTGYQNHFSLQQATFNVDLKSSIYDLGYKADATIGQWKAGAMLVRHSMQPQQPEISGNWQVNIEHYPRQNSIEASLYSSYLWEISRLWQADFGIRATVYNHQSATFFSADPGITVRYSFGQSSTLSLQMGIKHQNLFQTGFSEMGLPTEFWFSAGRYKPQYAYNVSIGYDTYLDNRTWHLSAELYYKRLYHQVEYNGNIFDFIYSTYDFDKALLWGHGYNYGLNVLAEKRKGKLTGWMSYAVGRAMRRYPGTIYTSTYPANHERIHEFNAVATYRLDRHWSVGATLVAASGTPYTKAERLYLVSNHILAEYGKHNGNRVDMYGRMDVSINYDLNASKGHRQGFNLSLYNVTMRKNPLFYNLYLTHNPPPRISYSPFTFAVKLLPSINYYYSF